MMGCYRWEECELARIALLYGRSLPLQQEPELAEQVSFNSHSSLFLIQD